MIKTRNLQWRTKQYHAGTLSIDILNFEDVEERETHEDEQDVDNDFLGGGLGEDLADHALLVVLVVEDVELLLAHPVALERDQRVLVLVLRRRDLLALHLHGLLVQLDDADQAREPDDADDARGAAQPRGLRRLRGPDRVAAARGVAAQVLHHDVEPHEDVEDVDDGRGRGDEVEPEEEGQEVGGLRHARQQQLHRERDERRPLEVAEAQVHFVVEPDYSHVVREQYEYCDHCYHESEQRVVQDESNLLFLRS